MSPANSSHYGNAEAIVFVTFAKLRAPLREDFAGSFPIGEDRPQYRKDCITWTEEKSRARPASSIPYCLAGLQFIELLAALEVKRTLPELGSKRRGKPQFVDSDGFETVLKNTVEYPRPIQDSDIRFVLLAERVFFPGIRLVWNELVGDEECLSIIPPRRGDLCNVRTKLVLPVFLSAERKSPSLGRGLPADADMPNKRQIVRNRVGFRVHPAVSTPGEPRLG
jgi:hypothetical protein